MRTDSYYDFIKAHWQEHILADTTWEQALHDGTLLNRREPQERQLIGKPLAIDDALASLSDIKTTSFELTLYTTTALGDGQQVNNPWLQELPDPLTCATWDNYLCMHPTDAESLGIGNWHTAGGALEEHLAKLKVADKELKVPVYIQHYEIGRASCRERV